MAAIAFIQRHIRYDAGLARDYDQGLCEGLSLEEAWTLGQGTCREIAMVMGALCQAQGIPVRFVQGIRAPDRLHCWNEVYFDGAGWLPVDAQAGMIGQWGI